MKFHEPRWIAGGQRFAGASYEARVLLNETVVTSTVANVQLEDFVDTARFSTYAIEFFNVGVALDAAQFRMALSNNNGITFTTDAGWCGLRFEAASINNSADNDDTQIDISDAGDPQGNVAGEEASGRIDFLSMGDSLGGAHGLTYDLHMSDAGTSNPAGRWGAWAENTVRNVDAVILSFEGVGANITSGTFRLYGIR